jgi:hypothetical protein
MKLNTGHVLGFIVGVALSCPVQLLDWPVWQMYVVILVCGFGLGLAAGWLAVLLEKRQLERDAEAKRLTAEVLKRANAAKTTYPPQARKN